MQDRYIVLMMSPTFEAHVQRGATSHVHGLADELAFCRDDVVAIRNVESSGVCKS